MTNFNTGPTGPTGGTGPFDNSTPASREKEAVEKQEYHVRTGADTSDGPKEPTPDRTVETAQTRLEMGQGSAVAQADRDGSTGPTGPNVPDQTYTGPGTVPVEPRKSPLTEPRGPEQVEASKDRKPRNR